MSIILQGINWDEKSSYQQGPAKGPALIREALYSGSMNLSSELGVEMETIGLNRCRGLSDHGLLQH